MNDKITRKANTDAVVRRELLPLESYLRSESPWPWRAWVAFAVVLVVCTSQALPEWTHPSLLLGWHPLICIGIVALCGAISGMIIARYRYAGLLAGAIAGAGGLLTAIVVFDALQQYSRYAVVLVEVAGMVPGLVLYCVLHHFLDRFHGAPGETHGALL